ncbi:MAG: PilZ domain-containing protein [Candidatus Omnitrophica bacterium]|nr:PilZ domain-containing protein [Candidatus Omnitrophota bacterium]
MVRYRSVRKGLVSWVIGRVLDLSVANVRIVCEHAFAIDEEMEVQLRLPGDELVLVRGRVSWARPFGVQQFEHVVSFIGLDPEVQKAIAGSAKPLT